MLSDLELENRKLRAELNAEAAQLGQVIAFLEIPYNRMFRFKYAHRLLLKMQNRQNAMVCGVQNVIGKIPPGFTRWPGATDAVPCPVDRGIRVNIVFRDGEVLYDVPALVPHGDIDVRDASKSFWKHEKFDSDIVGWQFA